LIDNQNITEGSSNSQRKKKKERKKEKAMVPGYGFFHFCMYLYSYKNWCQNDGAHRAAAATLFFHSLPRQRSEVPIVALEENNNSAQHDRHRLD
jgi:hypothetical protein